MYDYRKGEERYKDNLFYFRQELVKNKKGLVFKCNFNFRDKRFVHSVCARCFPHFTLN